jgi:spore coat protein U-like protein
MRSKILMPVVAGVLLTAAAPTFAVQKSVTMGVSASVASNCVVAATNLAFGPYDGSAPLTNSAPISVRCTNGTPYDLLLSTGDSASYTQRLLSNGSNTLQYNLFTSSAASTIWGDGTTSSTGKISGNGAGMSSSAAITHQVHGVLPNSAANQDAPVGSYSDTITVTVSY